MILVLDSETTGLFDFKLPADHDSQPRIVELSWAVLNDKFEVINEVSTLINPGDALPTSATEALNGITAKDVVEYGVPPLAALAMLQAHLATVRHLIIYNLHFDLKALRGECRRLGQSETWLQRPRLRQQCAMQLSSACLGSKWMKLAEAHQQLVGEAYEATHRASDDRDATIRVAWALHRRGALEL